MPVLMRATGAEPTSLSNRGASRSPAPSGPPGPSSATATASTGAAATTTPGGAATTTGCATRGRDALLDERVPGLATGALPQPLSRLKPHSEQTWIVPRAISWQPTDRWGRLPDAQTRTRQRCDTNVTIA